MEALSEREMLQLWEVGAPLNAVDRALLLLGRALPGIPSQELATTSIGRRNASLLALRTSTFGSELHGSVICPTCHERVDLTIDSGDLGTSVCPAPPRELEIGPWRVICRLPDSHDLAAAATCPDVAAARALLIDRCVVARHEDQICSSRQLPADVVASIGDQIAACDPDAELLIDLTCQQCGCSWQREIDVVWYLWGEIERCAKRVLGDIDVLARTYGWSETEILELNFERRLLYVEMALS